MSNAADPRIVALRAFNLLVNTRKSDFTQAAYASGYKMNARINMIALPFLNIQQTLVADS